MRVVTSENHDLFDQPVEFHSMHMTNYVVLPLARANKLIWSVVVYVVSYFDSTLKLPSLIYHLL